MVRIMLHSLCEIAARCNWLFFNTCIDQLTIPNALPVMCDTIAPCELELHSQNGIMVVP